MRALLARFPALGHGAAPPIADLGVAGTPLERRRVDGVDLLIKRDDLSAAHVGGNKVRALEFLLGAVPPGRTLLTVGATGSTHALSVATHAARRGLATEIITWPQEDHVVSRATSAALAGVGRVTPARSVLDAYLRAAVRRLRGGRHWIPAGGSTPLGAMGHVNAALELADQLSAMALAPPRFLVVPLGSGGTAAGLLAGLALAALPTTVVAVQVVPRIVARTAHVLRLARRARALVARDAGVVLPPIDASRLVIERDAYGGAYGRETDQGRSAAAALARAGGPVLDGTYSAKAFAVALDRARTSPADAVLFWLTFDARWLTAPAA